MKAEFLEEIYQWRASHLMCREWDDLNKGDTTLETAYQNAIATLNEADRKAITTYTKWIFDMVYYCNEYYYKAGVEDGCKLFHAFRQMMEER